MLRFRQIPFLLFALLIAAQMSAARAADHGPAVRSRLDAAAEASGSNSDGAQPIVLAAGIKSKYVVIPSKSSAPPKDFSRARGTSSGRFDVDRARATQSGKKTTSTSKGSSKRKAASKGGSEKKARHRRTSSSSRSRKADAAKGGGLKQILITTQADDARVDEIAKSHRLRVLDRRFSALLRSKIVRLEFNDRRRLVDVVAALGALSEVGLAAPNDAYGLQGEDYEPIRFAPKALDLDRLGKAGGKGVRIAIIDTDVDRSHPALSNVTFERFDGLPNMAIKQRRHGTAVLGLIAGRRMLRGIAPDAHILIARAFDGPAPDKLQSNAFVLVACLDWAMSKHATVVNMSFAGPPNALLEQALRAASDAGAALVAAAGNNGPKAEPAYPAAYESTIAVTATDAKNMIYGHANRGDYIFVSAPGVDILAPVPNGKVEIMSGTSFAAALVSGAVALAEEHLPRTPAAALRDLLKKSTRDLGAPGKDSVYGYGLLDVSALIGTRVTSQVHRP